MKINHKKEIIELIEECIRVRNKSIKIPLKLNKSDNDIDFIDICVDCILEEFCEKGLKDDDEPNNYGLKLEEAIEFLNIYRYKLDE